MLTLPIQPVTATHMPQLPHLAPPPLSAAALAEAEAAHAAQGLRLQEARRAQEQWAVETARRAEELALAQAKEAAQRAAEQALKEAEASRALQAQLQQQLQALAAADAEAAQAFAARRESLARESQDIAQKLQLLQASGSSRLAPTAPNQPVETSALPPHLLHIVNQFNSVQSVQQQGFATPNNNAQGLAEPLNLAQQASAVPLQTAPLSGAPRPEEANRE
jgi:hypothetical protein